MQVDYYHDDNQEQEFEKDNVLSSDVTAKYKAASEIATMTMKSVMQKCTPEAYIADVCQFGDDLIQEMCSKVFIKYDRGLAFPTCISPNNTIQNFTPIMDVVGGENGARIDRQLKQGDLIKIELGVHIDGYIATVAHTMIVGGQKEPTQGLAANAVCAAYFAYMVATKMMQPGVRSSQVTKAIQEIARIFGCQPVNETGSFLIKRYILEADKSIKNISTQDKKSTGQNEVMTKTMMADEQSGDFEFEQDEVYGLNIIMSSGTGLSRESTKFTSQIFQRDVHAQYPLKLKTSRACLSEIESKFSVFPFAARSLLKLNNLHRIGIQECIDHGIILPLPVLEEKPDKLNPVYVAQFKSTIMIMSNSPAANNQVGETRTVSLFGFGNADPVSDLPLPYVQSAYSLNGTIYEEILTNGYKVESKSISFLTDAQTMAMEE